MAVWSFGFVFLITFSLILLFRPAALRYGLVDQPGGRKTHQGPVPLVGGLAMFGGLIFSLWPSPMLSLQIFYFMAASAFVVFSGLLDDYRGLSAIQKFTLQILAALLMVACNVVLQDLGNLLSFGPVALGVWCVPFTVFAAVGMMNAMNMIDGMDGLAGGLALIAFVCLALIAAVGGQLLDSWLLHCLVAAVLAFLCFNLRWPGARPARVFMGDAGSLLLGFLLSWFTIDLSQGGGRAMTPVTALWILAIPLLDTVSLMLRRIFAGKSPFRGDREHLHHMLLNLGLSINQTLCIILGMALLFALIGVGGFYLRVPEARLFFTFLSVAGVYLAATHYIAKVIGARRRRQPVAVKARFTESLVLQEIEEQG